MKAKFKCFLGLLGFILFVHSAFAGSVDRIVIVPRNPDRYVRLIGAVLNTKTGQTLVTWQQHAGAYWEGNSIWGQLLKQDGIPEGSPFQIISGGFNPIRATLAYDPDANQFVLVFRDRQEDDDQLYALCLKPTGRRKGEPARFTNHPSNDWPVIFYDSVNKANIVLFHRFDAERPDPANPKGVYGVILNPNLTVRKKPVFLQTNETGPDFLFGPFITGVSFHKPSGKLLLGQTLYTPVTWQSECFLAQVDPSLRNSATVLKLDEERQNSFCGVKLMQLPNGQVLSLFSPDDGVKKRKINSSGVPSGTGSKFFAEPVRSVLMGLLGSAYGSSNTSKEFAVLGFIGSEIEQAQFWLQRANSTGKVVGPAIQIESGVDCVHGGIISALPSVPAGGHLYAVLYIEGERDQPPLVNQGSGLVLLRVNTAP